ncbi:unnamed protein product, partial [Rotaria sp. Silwood2]
VVEALSTSCRALLLSFPFGCYAVADYLFALLAPGFCFLFDCIVAEVL